MAEEVRDGNKEETAAEGKEKKTAVRRTTGTKAKAAEPEKESAQTRAKAATRTTEKKTGESSAENSAQQEAPAAPKKKKIVGVFRPQNSKTGMVKPGSRPRPAGSRPAGAAGTRPAGTRPAGTRPAGARPAGARPAGARPEAAAGTRPAGARPAGARPAGTEAPKTAGTKPAGTRPAAARTENAAPAAEGRAQAGRTAGARPAGVRPQGAGRGDQNRAAQGRPSRGQGGGRPLTVPKAPAESKPVEKESRKRGERGDRNRQEKGDKFDRMEKNARQNQRNSSRRTSASRTQPPKKPAAAKPAEKIHTVTLPEKMTVGELAVALKLQASAVVKKLMAQGKMLSVNEEIDFDTAEEVALEFNYICEKEQKVDVIEEMLKEEEDPPETLVPRPPVVCVMGHVDHGKTSLLDAIRNTNVIEGEAGGITQHIGAYVVTVNGQKITFLDTPGHEAFTAMRMRGANSTDIAILVVAADDGVMPQTIEAINHAKAAGIEIIVAVNKIDKESANVERVKQELSEHELIPEDWGGSTVFVPVSARTHEGIDNLLEMILLTAEVSELKANPNRKARGLVIEARLDKGKGPVATVLVQKGTLHVGDPVAVGPCYGHVRAMMDENGRRVKEAGPSTPVEILGLSDVPNAGDTFIVTESEKDARSFSEAYISQGRERMLEETKPHMSLDDVFSQIQTGNLKEMDLIVKADVQGSVEAVQQSLLKLSNDEVLVKVIHSGVGAITESDVTLASASNAIIIGFNVRPDASAKDTADQENVDIRLYRVIYDAIADVEAAMKGMLDPVYEEQVIGHAEIRQLFKASGVGTIAGSYVLDGCFQRGSSVRITRDGNQIFEGPIASLKRFKDDVKEVKAGYECGLVFEKFNDIQVGDIVEDYVMVEVPR